MYKGSYLTSMERGCGGAVESVNLLVNSSNALSRGQDVTAAELIQTAHTITFEGQAFLDVIEKHRRGKLE